MPLNQLRPGHPSNPIMPTKPVSPGDPKAGSGNFVSKDPRPGQEIKTKPSKTQRPPPGKKGGGKRKSSKRTPNKAFLAASAKWRDHLADYRVKNPGQSLKKQMQGAKKTYKKSKSQPSVLNSSHNSVEIRNRSTRTRTKPKKPVRTKKRKKKSKKSKKLFGLF